MRWLEVFISQGEDLAPKWAMSYQVEWWLEVANTSDAAPTWRQCFCLPYTYGQRRKPNAECVCGGGGGYIRWRVMYENLFRTYFGFSNMVMFSGVHYKKAHCKLPLNELFRKQLLTLISTNSSLECTHCNLRSIEHSLARTQWHNNSHRPDPLVWVTVALRKDMHLLPYIEIYSN